MNLAEPARSDEFLMDNVTHSASSPDKICPLFLGGLAHHIRGCDP